MDTVEKALSWYDFDLLLSESLTADELIWWDLFPKEIVKYNWTTVAIQSNILKVWRFIKFKYNSLDRFMIWDSYIISDVSKPYINEPLLTN